MDMDIGYLVNEVEKARLTILTGKVVEGIEHLFRLRKAGYKVDSALVEDIVNFPSFLDYLYDQTCIGDAITSTRCLAALKGLGLSVDSNRINYVRYKKLAIIGKDIPEFIEGSRTVIQRLLKTLQSFHVLVGDFRECVVHKAEHRITFDEEITLRFPNVSFRDIFLQNAFHQAVEKGLNFRWENRTAALNQELTGRICWSLVQEGTDLTMDWHHSIKARFDNFILALLEGLENLSFPRFIQVDVDESELLWLVYSRDTTISRRISNALRGYPTIAIQDKMLLSRYLQQDESRIGAFVFHVSLRDLDIVAEIVDYKLQRHTTGPPFIVLAETPFFTAMRDPSALFPGCEYLAELSPTNIQGLEFTATKVLQNRRRFIRLPVDMECRAVLSDQPEHTRATPVSPAGTFIKTHRLVPIFSEAKIQLVDHESGFEESLIGNIIYNQRNGSAVRFTNVISFDNFRKLREIALNKQQRIIDTLNRSVI